MEGLDQDWQRQRLLVAAEVDLPNLQTFQHLQAVAEL